MATKRTDKLHVGTPLVRKRWGWQTQRHSDRRKYNRKDKRNEQPRDLLDS